MDFKEFKDRGMKKWHGFMMPEHIGSLGDMWHDDEKEKKPILDETQLQEIDETLHAAIEFNMPIILTLWIDGFLKEEEGRLHHVDNVDKRVSLVDSFGNVSQIDFENIVKVEFKD
ncbi:YolD-like family protein [Lederbergia citri]|uniref:YolD-like family protein n=1 Tax=Lederbergia citri TaxID=2833580 RepID=A0A942YHH3_9BACI|nr:YolD-like family protein [Lederbergia citri]MBS4195784.1 YolD-like family protein [Lederbergia citri]